MTANIKITKNIYYKFWQAKKNKTEYVFSPVVKRNNILL